MSAARATLHDIGWPGRHAVIEYNDVTSTVEIRIVGPSGGIHGRIDVPATEADESFAFIQEAIRSRTPSTPPRTGRSGRDQPWPK